MPHNQKEFISGLLKAWRDEKLSAANYRALAEKERIPERKSILLRLAEAEDRHAERWEQRLRELGADPGEFRETAAEKIQRNMLLKSEIGAAVQLLETGEREADKLYDILLANAPAESDRQALLDAQREERAHSKILEEFQSPRHHHTETRLDNILRHERWHVRGGGWIGQAIYGVNDGLGAAFGVVSGVAGATSVKGEWILLSGFATMLASALSMGSGAYLATKSEREVYEAELEREKKEIEENPEEEQEELQLIYQLKGFTEEEAKTMVQRLAAQPDQMLKTLAHEELGLSERSFPNEWKSAFSAMVSTAIGASIPVIPFIFTSGMHALIISFVISTLAHFAVGASKVIVTGRSWLKSGTEMTLIGIGEAAVTYAIGMLIAPAFG
jgi:VIT1/CCC1 family predicted Fe2+/Mn2+ transporter/rubrerythrin